MAKYREYLVRNKYEWAKFVIGDDGYFSVISSYGGWAYYWSSTGCADFRNFLIELKNDEYYFSSKVEQGHKKFNLEDTLKLLKKEILLLRRSRTISKEIAREEFNEINCIHHEYEYYDWERESNLRDLIEDWPYAESYSNDVKFFFRKLFHEFVKLLEIEIKDGVCW